MTVLVDSWAWIEYFKGSNLGIKAKNVIESGEQLLISTINISEIYHFLLNNKMDAEKLIKFVLDSSFVIQLDTQIAIKAANIKFTKKLGMADAIVLATAEENNAMILTGDDDFKNIKNVIYIGK
ncbi:type II toxin-antitoxin system VapC family toxin [Candidatus Woesearchaeota archaeon]|nr:type II toxin-antitoxin system VapC family toxin [Candidatus Woesearchaeota archaeon]